MRKEVIITGVNGFVGGHLAQLLHDKGYTVRGIGREPKENENITGLLDAYSSADLLDAASLASLNMGSASAIIHLAGLASVADSFKYPDKYKVDNRTMADNLLTSAKVQGFTGRAVIISTGAVYDATQPMPLSEQSLTSGNSPYSIGKLATETVTLSHKHSGMDIVIARPFNHIGPGQGSGFLLSDLYEQIVSAKQSGATTIGIGNLSSRRDYTDVRDIVVAYELLANSPRLDHDIYNIASGNSYSSQEVLDMLQGAMHTHLQPIIDQSKFRPTDAAEIIGDANRIKNELGWVPSIPLSKTIADYVSSKD